MIYNAFIFYRPLQRKSFFRLMALIGLPLLLGSAAHAASGDRGARRQVYAEAVRLATADLKAQAQREQWTDYRASFTVFIPNDISRNAACKTALQTAIPTAEQSSLLRMRYDIRCEDGPGWETSVTVKPTLYLAILVSTKMLPRGARLTSDDMEFKKRNIATLYGNFLTDRDSALGLTLKRRVLAQQPLSPSALEQPTLVERGQSVVLVAEQQGVSAHTLGEALQKGRRGDLIKVRNGASQKTVMARVTDVGVVTVMALPVQ